MSFKAFTPHHFCRLSSIDKPLTRKSGAGFTHAPSFSKSGAGFTLIEILVATTLITVGIVGFYAAITRVTSITLFSPSRFVASRLAQEGIELVSNIRDTNWVKGTANWDDGLTDCSSGCEIDYNDSVFTNWTEPGRYLKIDSNGFYNYDNGDDSKFKRKITITHINPDEIKVKVQITWPGKGSSLEVLEVEEHLYNWK